MGLYEDALASIDPNTGFVDVRPGSLWDQYSKQQEASLANMRATTQLSPELKYLQANPDVLGHATRTAAAEGIAPGEDFGLRTQQIAAQHFMNKGAEEGRNGFGLPLSTVGQPPEISTMPIMTAPYNPVPPNPTTPEIPGNPTMPGGPTMPGMSNYGPAPLPGQLPGYSFTANPNQYANNLGNFGGLLDDTSPFYAGQVPIVPPGGDFSDTQYRGGYSFPELNRYPNANYASGGFTPIIYTY